MKERVRYMYEEGNVSFTDVLFGSSGLSDFFNRLEYRYRIMKYDNEIYSNYESAREKAEISEKLLTARLNELEALQEFRETQIASLESIAEKKAEELLKTSAALSIDTYELFANWDELMETDDVADVLEGIHEEDMASYMLENIMWPLPGKKYISSHYGYREAPTEGATVFHSGIDIPATTGTEAKAALSGVVVAATYDPGSGNYVKISHGNGVYTSYCHASKLMVKVGDRVKKGQTVILVGSTGISTGPHLHFGVQVDGYYRNPLDYVWYGKE
ncbi:MAG: peptidoglycan DD-metalloendopeptidase family protein [Lachnospiraceae bacterium]|nr:peptidoglycan DD-metalloendopeptidase family protein [Lachnospiraceae bacterium]